MISVVQFLAALWLIFFGIIMNVTSGGLIAAFFWKVTPVILGALLLFNVAKPYL